MKREEVLMPKCDNCGRVTDKVYPVRLESVGEVELLCEDCYRDWQGEKRWFVQGPDGEIIGEVRASSLEEAHKQAKERFPNYFAVVEA